MKTVISKMEERMNKCLGALDRNFNTIRAGRANAAVLDKIQVEYYGTPTPINQMAAISTPDPRTLKIQPWDKTTLKDIEKAILISDLGINPQNDGNVIRLNFPPLTEERRKDLAKEVGEVTSKYKNNTTSLRSFKAIMIPQTKIQWSPSMRNYLRVSIALVEMIL